ncbi:hypothetical protein B835_2056 [Enterococcus mundtii 3F]|uniref:pLS20_p028 family conjugation system transmembrane protein n=1 Tax=Enterococcus mundtii TaxID=53346 RepID=UPI0023049908|nr:hypothetical protein [Enterococcus mundtii]MDA9462127.1 hypothetical protein [Enterococcus mundtii 3F]
MIGGIFSDIGDWFSGLFGDGADSDAVTKVLQDYSQYLQYQDVFSWIGNTILWGLIKLFYSLNKTLEDTIYQSFSLKDVLNAAGVSTLYQDLISKLAALLMVVTLIYIGIKFSVSKNPPQIKNVFINLLLAMLIIVGGSSLIDQGLNLSQSFYGDISSANQSQKSNSPAFQLIQNNVYDISTVLDTDPAKVTSLPTDQRNPLTAENFQFADINGVITPDQISKITKDNNTKLNDEVKERITALQYKLEIDDTGKKIPVKIDDTGLAQYVYTSGYRQYYSESWTILVGEVSLAVAYLFILFTIVICIIELVFKKFYLVIAASTDLETGQRMKTAINDVSQSFLLLAFTILELQIYVTVLSGIGDLHTAGKLNGFLYLVSLIVLTVALFKGSQAVTKIFGVDTSLKNGANSLMSAFALTQTAKNAAGGAKSVVNAGKNSLSKLNEIRKNGFKHNKNDESTDSDNNNGNASTSLPRSTKKVSEVLGKGKEGLSKAVQGAGYLHERGLKGAAKDVKEKAKETVNDKLEDTRAKDVANAIKNPSEALEKQKEKVDQLKNEVGDSFAQGQVSAAVKANESAKTSVEKEQEENQPVLSQHKFKTNAAIPEGAKSEKIPMAELPKRNEDHSDTKIELPNKGIEVGSMKSTKINLPGNTPALNSQLDSFSETDNTFTKTADSVKQTHSRLPENGNMTTVSYGLKDGNSSSNQTSIVTKERAPKPMAKTHSGYRPANINFTTSHKFTVSKETQEKEAALKNQILNNAKNEKEKI